MHPDLSPHLHTEECNKYTLAFRDCNVEVRETILNTDVPNIPFRERSQTVTKILGFDF